jgi:hypothetical protein
VELRKSGKLCIGDNLELRNTGKELTKHDLRAGVPIPEFQITLSPIFLFDPAFIKIDQIGHANYLVHPI